MMHFDVNDPEVKSDIRCQCIAKIMCLISRVLDTSLFKIFLWLSVVIFSLLFAAWCIATRSININSVFIGLALIVIGYPLIIICITKALGYFSDKIIHELVKKYTFERDNFINSRFIELGFKKQNLLPLLNLYLIATIKIFQFMNIVYVINITLMKIMAK